MNKNFSQTAGQAAHKSYPSCVLRETDITMEVYNNGHQFNLSTGQVTRNVASPAHNEPVIGLEDWLLLTRWSLPDNEASIGVAISTSVYGPSVGPFQRLGHQLFTTTNNKDYISRQIM